MSSTTSKYAKLIMVTEGNNNKYYEMIYEGGNNFTVNYGRVELTKTTITKPFRQWNSIYNEKIRKGYKDVTDLVSVQTNVAEKDDSPLKGTGVAEIDEFLTLMKKYRDNLVDKTYSVKAVNVSQKQLDEAQNILVSIAKQKKTDTNGINKLLINLYTTIPRKMSNVRDFILPKIDLLKTLEQEQDNLDAMASQVAALTQGKSVKKVKTVKKENKTLLDVLGITMDFKKKSYSDIQYLLDQHFSGKVQAVFEVNKPSEDAVFDSHIKTSKNKSTKILIHGTRCTSVIPILEQGLKIRPTGNFQFSGKVYGDGNYFSEVMSKSLNYTGYDRDKVLLVYEVHTGNPFVYDGWYKGNSFTLNHKELSSRGFDSTYVKAGGGLLNSEIITYTEQQNRIKYIIWLKN